jgi:hypothetical protein
LELALKNSEFIASSILYENVLKQYGFTAALTFRKNPNLEKKKEK